MTWTYSTHEIIQKPIQKFRSENIKGLGPFEDLGIRVSIILKWILNKCHMKLWTDLVG
jgi:hypothetical protein